VRMRLTGLWLHSDFLKLWTGQTISQFGSQVTILALPLAAALTLHASVAEIGLLSAMSTLPFLLFGLIAGVWVDRMSRRPILIAADLGRAVLLFLVPALALCHVLNVAALVVIAFLVGIFTVFFEVAYQSFLPSLVGSAHLIDGNAKLEITRSAAQVAGPGVAGVLVQLITAPLAIVVDALSFVVSVLFLTWIRTPEPLPTPRDPKEIDIWREIGEGMHFMRNAPLLKAITAGMGTINLFGSIIFTVLVLYATRDLGIGAGLFGTIFMSGNLGFLLGALIARITARRFGIGPSIIGAVLILGIGGLLVPLASGPRLVTVSMLIVAQFSRGLGGAVFNINNLSVRQAVTPTHLLGRINAIVRVIGTGALSVGALAGGTLGSVLGLRPTLGIGAIGSLFAVAWCLWSPLRTLRGQNARMAEPV